MLPFKVVAVNTCTDSNTGKEIIRRGNTYEVIDLRFCNGCNTVFYCITELKKDATSWKCGDCGAEVGIAPFRVLKSANFQIVEKYNRLIVKMVNEVLDKILELGINNTSRTDLAILHLYAQNS